MKFAGGLLGLLISVVLFAGFSLVNYASSDEAGKFISASAVTVIRNNKPFLYGFLILIFLMQQVWLRLPKITSLAEVHDARKTIEPFLELVLLEYYKAVSGIAQGQAVVSVRINIMLPTWRRFRCGQYLKIYYAHGGPAKLRYNNDELELAWRSWSKGRGTCGDAWSKKHIVIFDSDASGLQGPAMSLTLKQLETVAHIKSVLSVPIRHSATKKIVGILNLDSTYNVDKTFFNREDVVNIVTATSSPLSMMLFRDVVAAH
jgi:hypothetical protein